MNPWTYKPDVTIPSFHIEGEDPNVDNSTGRIAERLKQEEARNSET